MKFDAISDVLHPGKFHNEERIEDSIQFTRYIAYNISAPIIICMGVLGNILTILILRHPTFKGVMYNFYLALSAFDFLSLIMSISALVHFTTPATTSYALVVWYSYFEILVINACMGTSVLIVICITFDRYMSVRHPHKFKSVHTNTFCKAGIAASFLISVVIWFPTCFIKEPRLVKDCSDFLYINVTDPLLWISCQTIDPDNLWWYRAYTWIREIIVSFLPIVLVIIFNSFLIKYFIDKHKPKERSGSTTQTHPVPSERLSCDKSLSSLLQAIILCLVVTLLPGGIFNAIYLENLKISLKYEIFGALAHNLELLNHALNFYLYVLMSKPVRTTLPSILARKKEQILRRIGSNVGSDINGDRNEPQSKRESMGVTVDSEVVH